jgi:hypothetical protein
MIKGKLTNADDQISDLLKWLNPRGQRDNSLLKALKVWLPEIEASFHRRRVIMGIEKPDVEEDEVRRRPSRRVAGGEEEGYLGWKVSFRLYNTI